MEIVRTYEATVAVFEELQRGSSKFSSEQPTERSVAALESALRELFAVRRDLIEEPWNCTAFITFLDGAPLPASLASATVTLLKNKVE